MSGLFGKYDGIGALPFEDESFDIVLSLNGFHAFPDKEAACRETCRVLKPGGTFAIHDLMSPSRCGDMEAFLKKRFFGSASFLHISAYYKKILLRNVLLVTQRHVTKYMVKGGKSYVKIHNGRDCEALRRYCPDDWGR